MHCWWVGSLKCIQHDCQILLLAKRLLESRKESWGHVPKILSLTLPQLAATSGMYAWARLDLQYTHNEWSSITSPGLLIIGLSSLASQLEEMLPYATALKTYIDNLTCYLPRLEVHSTHNFHTCFWLPFLLIRVIVFIRQSGFYTCPYPCKLYNRLKICMEKMRWLLDNRCSEFVLILAQLLKMKCVSGKGSDAWTTSQITTQKGSIRSSTLSSPLSIKEPWSCYTFHQSRAFWSWPAVYM